MPLLVSAAPVVVTFSASPDITTIISSSVIIADKAEAALLLFYDGHQNVPEEDASECIRYTRSSVSH